MFFPLSCTLHFIEMITEHQNKGPTNAKPKNENKNATKQSRGDKSNEIISATTNFNQKNRQQEQQYSKNIVLYWLINPIRHGWGTDFDPYHIFEITLITANYEVLKLIDFS